MQTFLPYADFFTSTQRLDHKRLCKQRVESCQIFRIVCGIDSSSRWRNHPAVKMWEGYTWAIAHYMNACIKQWVYRQFNNTMILQPLDVYPAEYPVWLYDEEFHASHRSNLLRKDPEYYGRFGWQELPDLPYLWPVFDSSKKGYRLERR